MKTERQETLPSHVAAVFMVLSACVGAVLWTAITRANGAAPDPAIVQRYERMVEVTKEAQDQAEAAVTLAKECYAQRRADQTAQLEYLQHLNRALARP